MKLTGHLFTSFLAIIKKFGTSVLKTDFKFSLYMNNLQDLVVFFSSSFDFVLHCEKYTNSI